MMVLAVNGGSSSLHLALVSDGQRVAERLDIDLASDHRDPRTAVTRFVTGRPRPAAVGHRLVHGGRLVPQPVVVDDDLRRRLDQLEDLAPMHLPSALRLLDQLREVLPDLPHVLCPDTAFHLGLPDVAAVYPLPADWRRRWSLRRAGFHGLSYTWALRRAAELLGRPVGQLQLVMTHLGGGCSVCAVREGRSVDTSMGFTPLDGVPMSTRSGAVDPGMLLWLLDGRVTRDELADGLNRRSGLLGLSDGRSGDTRELVAAAADGDAAAKLALDVFSHRVLREIAAATTSLQRLDALVFTGEIGWNQPEVRAAVCAGLRQLGVPEPVRGNRSGDGPISPEDARVPVLVVEPQEELQIALQTMAILKDEKDRHR